MAKNEKSMVLSDAEVAAIMANRRESRETGVASAAVPPRVPVRVSAAQSVPAPFEITVVPREWRLTVKGKTFLLCDVSVAGYRSTCLNLIVA
jgi:hypothetical protein